MKKIVAMILMIALVASVSMLGASVCAFDLVDCTLKGQGLPGPGAKTYTDGDYSVKLDYNSGNISLSHADSGAITFTNIGSGAQDVYANVTYPVSALTNDILRYEFQVSFMGKTPAGSRTHFYAYDSTGADVVGWSDLAWSDGNNWRANGNPKISANGSIYKLLFDIDTLSKTCTGYYDFDKNIRFTNVNNKKANLGDGTITARFRFTVNEGGSATLHKTAVYDADYYRDSHWTLVDSVPEAFGLVNNVKVSAMCAGSAKAVIENGNIIISNTTNSSNYVRLQFTDFEASKTTFPGGRTLYIEYVCSFSAQPATIKINAKNSSSWTISGGPMSWSTNMFNKVGADGKFDTTAKYKLGMSIDLDTGKWQLYRDRVAVGSGGTLSNVEKGVYNIWLEIYGNSAVTTVSDLTYELIEPINYDPTTGTYVNDESLFMKGIPHIASVKNWNQNGYSFTADVNGKVQWYKVGCHDGVAFTNSNNTTLDNADDYARLSIGVNATPDTYPEGIAYAKWYVNVAGSQGQTINITCRKQAANGGVFPINHSFNINPGDHIIEFIYDANTNYYRYIVDGVASGLYHLEPATNGAPDGLPGIFVEWHGNDPTDVLTLTDIELRNLKGDDVDSVGDITIADDKMSAGADIYVSPAYSLLPDSAELILCAYNGGELVAISSQSANLVSGNNTLAVALDDLNGGTIVKAFLWDSQQGVVPLAVNAQK